MTGAGWVLENCTKPSSGIKFDKIMIIKKIKILDF
jgi:hypothetical protein